MNNRNSVIELIALISRAADTAPDAEQSRHILRSMYGALCCEAGMDKQEALAEFSEHWDKVEALQRRDNARMN